MSTTTHPVRLKHPLRRQVLGRVVAQKQAHHWAASPERAQLDDLKLLERDGLRLR
jgi:hypothetical protein